MFQKITICISIVVVFTKQDGRQSIKFMGCVKAESMAYLICISYCKLKALNSSRGENCHTVTGERLKG